MQVQKQAGKACRKIQHKTPAGRQLGKPNASLLNGTGASAGAQGWLFFSGDASGLCALVLHALTVLSALSELAALLLGLCPTVNFKELLSGLKSDSIAWAVIAWAKSSMALLCDGKTGSILGGIGKARVVVPAALE